MDIGYRQNDDNIYAMTIKCIWKTAPTTHNMMCTFNIIYPEKKQIILHNYASTNHYFGILTCPNSKRAQSTESTETDTLVMKVCFAL